MGLLQPTASLPRGSGQCNSCNKVPHCLVAVGRAVRLVQYTASLPGGSGPLALQADGPRGDSVNPLQQRE